MFSAIPVPPFCVEDTEAQREMDQPNSKSEKGRHSQVSKPRSLTPRLVLSWPVFSTVLPRRVSELFISQISIECQPYPRFHAEASREPGQAWGLSSGSLQSKGDGASSRHFSALEVLSPPS